MWRIENIDCHNSDVFVELLDRITYTRTVGTKASYEEYMQEMYESISHL